MKQQKETKQQKKLSLSSDDVKVTNFITQLEKEQARKIVGGIGLVWM